jgi:hypothetical protein
MYTLKSLGMALLLCFLGGAEEAISQEESQEDRQEASQDENGKSKSEQQWCEGRGKFGESGLKGLEILKKGAANYPKHRECFSCHHQTLPMFAMRMSVSGETVSGKDEEGEFEGEMHAIHRFSMEALSRDLAALSDSEELDGRGLTLGYALWTLDLANRSLGKGGVRSREFNRGELQALKLRLIRKALATQQEDGHWRIHSHRPPAASSELVATALVVSSLIELLGDLELPDSEKAAAREAIFRALVWYAQCEEPSTTEDYCGLLWLGSALNRFVNSELLKGEVFQGGIFEGPGGRELGRDDLDSDQDLFLESRIEVAKVAKQEASVEQAQAIARLLGLTDNDFFFKKYVISDTGELKLSRSRMWRDWLKSRYSREEILEIMRADRRRGLNDTGRRLVGAQNSDGGWGQAKGMESDAYSTGMVLLVLGEVYSRLNGGVPPTSGSPTYLLFGYHLRGLRYLMESQGEDGSWHVSSRATPVQEYFDNGDPHETDQFISIMGTAWATAALLNAWKEQHAPLSR